MNDCYILSPAVQLVTGRRTGLGRFRTVEPFLQRGRLLLLKQYNPLHKEYFTHKLTMQVAVCLPRFIIDA